MRVGVLASGSGTNLRAILERGVPVVVVIADRPCAALDVAREAGVAVELIERDDFGPRSTGVAYTHRVVDALAAHGVELVAMAGFGTMLEKPIHDAYPEPHPQHPPRPAPAFKGWHAVPAALAAGVKITGCTVHYATLEVDDGPILAQEAVPVLDGDTESSRCTNESRRSSAGCIPK